MAPSRLRTRRTRRFPFTGTTREYAKFLEDRVLQLEHQLSQRPPASQSSLTTPVGQISVFTSSVAISADRFKESGITLSDRRPVGVCQQYRSIDNFINQIPSSDYEWLKERTRLDLTTPEQSAITFRVLTRLANPDQSARQWPILKSRILPLKILDDYCAFASELQQSAQRETQQSKFADVLFLCICCVSLKIGVTINDIDERIKTYFRKPNLASTYCSRLRRASKWVAQMTERLELSLAHRGSELFVSRPSSLANNGYLVANNEAVGGDIALYQKLSEEREHADYINKRISERTTSFQRIAHEEGGLSFSLPFMVSFMDFR